MSAKQWHEENGVWLYGEKKLTATPAIHQYCMNKCCNTAYEVTKCENRECELWGFRTGKSLNTRDKTTCQSKDDSGKYLAVNSGKKSNLRDIGDDYTVPDDYEVVLRRKKEKK